MPYWRLFYHFVWGTRNRELLIAPEWENSLHMSVSENSAPTPRRVTLGDGETVARVWWVLRAAESRPGSFCPLPKYDRLFIQATSIGPAQCPWESSCFSTLPIQLRLVSRPEGTASGCRSGPSSPD